MRGSVKIKALATRVPVRKAAVTSSAAAARRSFPAWIDASDAAVAFPARRATPRVRDALVLRTVAARKKSAKPEGSANVHRRR